MFSDICIHNAKNPNVVKILSIKTQVSFWKSSSHLCISWKQVIRLSLEIKRTCRVGFLNSDQKEVGLAEIWKTGRIEGLIVATICCQHKQYHIRIAFQLLQSLTEKIDFLTLIYWGTGVYLTCSAQLTTLFLCSCANFRVAMPQWAPKDSQAHKDWLFSVLTSKAEEPAPLQIWLKSRPEDTLPFLKRFLVWRNQRFHRGFDVRRSKGRYVCKTPCQLIYWIRGPWLGL